MKQHARVVWELSSGRGAAWLARLLGVQEVPGSNPGGPTNPANQTSRGLNRSPQSACCTGAYLENGGTIENAQAIAAHESPRTTKLYDRTGDEITLDEAERIAM